MKTSWLLSLLVLGFVGLVMGNVYGRTWYVKADGTGDAPTVKAGMDSAEAGDTVLVECGTYYEHDLIMKSAVHLRGENSSFPCAVIDAQHQGFLIYCASNATSTLIEGLVMTNGSPWGMECTGSPDTGPTVRNCVFSNNKNPTVGVTFTAPQFYNCVFYGNYGSGAVMVSAYAGAAPLVSNCTFIDNTAGIAVTTSGTANIENCIIANCQGFSLGSDDDSWISITCSDLYGNGSARDDSATVRAVPSCFMADPQFCGVAGSQNYYLQSDSPCAPGNHPSGSTCGLIGALPVNCGTVDVQNESWGTIKSIYQKKE